MMGQALDGRWSKLNNRIGDRIERRGGRQRGMGQKWERAGKGQGCGGRLVLYSQQKERGK